jgi:hypothetical protein
MDKENKNYITYSKVTRSKRNAPPHEGFAYGPGAFVDAWGDDRPKPKRKRKPKSKEQ